MEKDDIQKKFDTILEELGKLNKKFQEYDKQINLISHKADRLLVAVRPILKEMEQGE